MIGVGIDVTNAVRRPISVSSTGDPDVSSFSITGSAPAATEGNSGAKTFAFTITRTGGLTYAAAVDWAVTGNGSNPANAADFVGGVFPSGTANFAANAATATINVQVQGDTTVEPDEGFILTLSNPRTTGAIGTGTGTSTILNDDTGSSLSGMVAMGDSWTAITSYLDDWSTANPSVPFHKVAASGWKISDLQANVSAAAAYNPALITIMIGLNDLGTLGSSTWLTNLQTLVSSLRTAVPGVKIAVATVPASVSGANINTNRAVVNPQIRSAVGSWVDAVIPVGDWILDTDPGDGISDTTYYLNGSPPGHPTAALELILGKIFTAVLNPFFAGASAASPSAFSFVDRLGAAVSTSYTAFTQAPLTGMAFGHAATAVGTGAGTFQANRNGTSNGTNKTVFNGDWPAATVVASATSSPATSVNETVTIGTTADTFTATTGPVASDTFTHANGALTSTEVGSLPWVGPAQISGNKAILGQNSHAYAVCDPGLYDVDFSIDVTVPANESTLGGPQPMWWGTLLGGTPTHDAHSDFNRYYFADLRNGAIMYMFSGGAYPTINGTFTPPAAGTHTVRVVAKESLRQIQLYIDGTLQCTATHNNDPNWNATGTYLGFTEEGANASNAFDNLTIAAAA